MSKPRYTGNDHVVDTAEGHILAPFEVLDRLNAAASLATRLAEVERERDALREGLGRLVNHEKEPCSLDHHGHCQTHPGGDHEAGCATAHARALLGKETPDGQD